MISRLENLIKENDFEAALHITSTLKGLFYEQDEIVLTLDDLKIMLIEQDPKCQNKLDDLKHLLAK
jgi:hypothetical protein